MKLWKRFNTVFYKLMFTYSLLLIVTIVFVGISSYVMISRTLNEEVERNDKELLTYVETMSEHSVYSTVQKLYQKLVVPHYETVDIMSLFNEANLEKHMSDVYDAHHYLKVIVEAQYNVIDSIDFYFLKSNTIVSSELALHAVQNDVEDSWIKEISRVTEESHWFVTKTIDPKGRQINAITYIGPYPANAAANAKGYIAIHINEMALSNILKQSVNQDTSQLFILTPSEIVSRSGRNLPSDLSFIGRIRNYPNSDGHFVVDIDETSSIISFHTLESSGWKIVRVTSVEKFYAKNNYMRNILILIGVIALLIGYGISNILTARIYNPLKLIIDKTRRIFGEAHTGPADYSGDSNEYAQINAVINNLSFKVTSLETTLEANLPLIKNKLIHDLFQGNIDNHQDLAERFELLKVDLPVSQHYTFGILQLDFVLMSHLSLENRQFIIYSLIDLIEGYDKSSTLHCLACESSSGYRIEVLISSSEPDSREIASLFQELSSNLAANFFVTAVALVGPWMMEPLELEKIYKKSEQLFKYSYFLPSQSVFFVDELIRREQHTEDNYEDLLEEFARALKGKRLEQAKASLIAFMDVIKTGNCAADYCHKMLRDLVYVYYRFVKDMNLSTRDILTKQLFAEFENIRNVVEFEHWSMNVIETTFSFIEVNNKNKSSDIIKTVKEYVANHLSEDLSLDVAAGVVFLSPRYLSKIFKQEAGENFVDFVTKERMNAAVAKLGVSTDETIENIALQVGYNNPAYFTKRFKETFGVTPTAYRDRR
jgi:two-component system response regulator YesN